jgi:predicted LPLAT superfamily acyltransferase
VRPESALLRWPDLRRLGALSVGAVASALLPRSWDDRFAEAWFRAYRALAPETLDRVVARMARHLPAPPPEAALHALAEDHVRARIEDMWGRMRGLHRRGWRPAIALQGIEHVHGALERGRGVVVWAMRVGSATVIKQGFRAAGVPLHHLSRAEHGAPAKTRFGAAVVGPLYRRVEDRALAERIVIPLGGSLAYLRTIGERLAANRCVSLFGEHAGRQAVEVHVLGLRGRFALGAPSLAWQHGAGLVTAYALREGSFRYRVVVEEEIPVERELPRRRFAERAVRHFAGRLERSIVRHPGDWHAWFYLDALERSPDAESEIS